jgi:O-methyltransferase/methyltransferase family protein
LSSASELRRLVNTYQLSQAIHVAAVLGIADLLTDGPRSSDELATATETNPGALYRLLRALAAFGLFHEDDNRRFSLTELGDALRADAPESVAGWAAFVGRRNIRDAWSSLEESIRTGENAFKLAHGVSVWEYRAQNREESEIFDRAMASSSKLVIGSLIEAYDFGRFGTIVDVGGGNGTLLRALLAEYPRLNGVLFDQPHVVEGVDLGLRGRVVGGSFFESVPGGGDAYLLKWIIHDWDDKDSLTILRNVRAAGGTLLVVERIVDSPNEGPETKLGDLNMLVGPGGQERTLDEFRSLFEAAGYELVGETPTASGMHVIEGTPA